MSSPSPSPNPILFSGSCACTRITFTSTSLPTTVQACNCKTCRKLSGGPHQLYADIPSSSLTLLDTKTQTPYPSGFPQSSTEGISFLRMSAVGERVYCASCYTPLGMRYTPHPEFVGVTVSSIDEDTFASEEVKGKFKVQGHIFGSQKAFWVGDLGRDGVPVYERFSPELEGQYPELERVLRPS